MNSTAAATLTAIIRESETDIAGFDKTMAQIDALGLPAELTASVKAQTVAGIEKRAALAAEAQAELNRRRAADCARRGGIFAGRVS